jgi:hypothetical protein
MVLQVVCGAAAGQHPNDGRSVRVVSGSASCTAAGSTASATTNPATLALLKRGAPLSSTPLKTPDSPCGPPQGVSWAATMPVSDRDDVHIM